MFSGDCVLGEGTAVFSDLYTYIKTLERMLGESPGRIYPGHGPVLESGSAVISNYIEHRAKREAQILAAVKNHPDGLTSAEVVDNVYNNLSPTLTLAANGNVCLHLEKLLTEGHVKFAKGEAASAYKEFLESESQEGRARVIALAQAVAPYRWCSGKGASEPQNNSAL